MCGRCSIQQPMDHCLKKLAPEQWVFDEYNFWPIECYSVAPTTRVEIMKMRGMPAAQFTWFEVARTWECKKSEDAVGRSPLKNLSSDLDNQLQATEARSVPIKANRWLLHSL